MFTIRNRQLPAEEMPMVSHQSPMVRLAHITSQYVSGWQEGALGPYGMIPRLSGHDGIDHYRGKAGPFPIYPLNVKH